MNSVIPTVSSVAWSSYMTGVNPAKHNIFGFVDRVADPFDIFIPTARHMGCQTLWELLSRAGKRVIVINVPVTYPPRDVNGILIGGFLGTDINKIAYPPSLNPRLKEMEYRIDVDAWMGRKDKEKFFQDLFFTLNKRIEVADYLMEKEPWDFFQLHIMESDRVNHFLWAQWEDGDPRYTDRFLALYQRVDDYVGNLSQQLGEGVELVVLSDHGFCRVKKEVYLNYWLEKEGYLLFNQGIPVSLKEMSPATLAYSLVPGRVFINLKGREAMGQVEPDGEYETIRKEIREGLLTLTDPDTGEKIIDRVWLRDEIYDGPFFPQAADLIAIPHDGYDLKGNLNQLALTFLGDLVGMHTYDDASLFIKNREIVPKDNQLGITDLFPTLVSMMNLPVPEGIDGRSLI